MEALGYPLLSPHTHPMDIEIIVNPNSGRGGGPSKAGQIGAELARMGHRCRITLGRNREDATAWANTSSAKADRLVVVGGDGSLSAVIDGLPAKCPPLALAPFGTSNLLANELRIPKRPEGIAALACSSRILQLDTSRVHFQSPTSESTLNSRSFLAWGFGLDGELMRRMQKKRQGPIHKADYLPLVGRLLQEWQATPQRVIADGKDLGEFEFGIISGMRTYAMKGLRLGKAAYSDGLWELYLFPRFNLSSGSMYVAASAIGKLADAPGVVHCKAKSVRVEGAAPTPIQIDGDYVGNTPVDFSLNEPPLPILLPQR